MSMSSPSSDPDSHVPEDHVALVLLEEKESFFYLQIPIATIHSLCFKPLKYLLYLGWCILGVEGVLATANDAKVAISTAGKLDGGDVYYYVPNEPLDAHTVDLEIIKARTNSPSETTGTCERFRTAVEERDVYCVWTGLDSFTCDALHIIPFQWGSEWLRLIVKNRPHYAEDTTTLLDINDIRNGVLPNAAIHLAFNHRVVAFLKTPNHILKPKDIPRHRRHLQPGVSYPSHPACYTLHFLGQRNSDTEIIVPPNNDAAFKTNTRKAKPSDLLLHYTYGAAAVKCWGHNMEILANLAKPRPTAPHLPQAGPLREIHDSAGTEGLVESEGQATLDEDEVMLFFWGNTRAAKERHLKKVSENTRRLEQWRDGVP